MLVCEQERRELLWFSTGKGKTILERAGSDSGVDYDRRRPSFNQQRVA
jgi:hypothetical protein